MEGTYRYIITDVDQALWTKSWAIDQTILPLGSGTPWCIRKSTLKGGLQDGVDLIEVNNGALSFFIVPTRGMSLWKGSYKGIPLGWDSPVRDLVNPAFIDLNDRAGLGWLKGFNEWIVRCGLDSNGAPGNDTVIDNNGNETKVFLPLHGKVANIPARHVEIFIELFPPHRITVVGIVEETMMFGPRLRLTTKISTDLGSNNLTISDQVTNLNQNPSELQLLYHCNYGAPFLEKGAVCVAPFKTVFPRDLRALDGIKTFSSFSDPEPGFVEQVYFYELTGEPKTGKTAVLLKNKENNLGVSLHFNLRQMPCFTLWKNTNTIESGYVVGLEPATNYPNPKWFERQQERVVSLQNDETRQFDLSVSIHNTKQSVKEMESFIKQLQNDTKPKVSEQVSNFFTPAEK